MAKIGELLVDVLARTTGLQKGLSKGQRQMNQFKDHAAKIGMALGAAFGIHAVRTLITDFAQLGDQIEKTSRRTGVAAESISRLKFAAEQSGLDIETLEKGFFGLSRAVFDAGRGSAEVTEAFRQIGLSVDDLAGRTPEQQLMLIADNLQKLEDASTRGAVAQKIFGRAGRQLLPMLEQGAAGIRQLTEQAEELGIVMSEKDAKAAAEITDAMNAMSKQVKQVMVEIGGKLAPIITGMLNMFSSLGSSAIKFAAIVATFIGSFLAANIAIKVMVGLFTVVRNIMTAIAAREAFIAGLRQNWVGIAAGIVAATATGVMFSGAMESAETSTGKMAANMQEVEAAMGRAAKDYMKTHGFKIRRFGGPAKPDNKAINPEGPVIRVMSMQDSIKNAMDRKRNEILEKGLEENRDQTISLKHIANNSKRKDIEINRAASF